MVIYNPASPAGADRIRSLAKLQTYASKTAAKRALSKVNAEHAAVSRRLSEPDAQARAAYAAIACSVTTAAGSVATAVPRNQSRAARCAVAISASDI